MSLRDQLQAIYDARGELTPRGVVDEAQPKDHPLHDRFEWNDKIAGPKYREVQAAQLIRSVKVLIKDGGEDSEPVSIRAFHNVATPDRSSYVPVEAIADDPFLTQLVLRNAEREWKELHRKYGHLKEFLSLVAKDVAA